MKFVNTKRETKIKVPVSQSVSNNIRCLRFEPVNEQQSFFTILNIFGRATFLLLLILLVNLMNLWASIFLICGFSEIGSMKYLWVSLLRPYIILIDVLHEFSIIWASLLNKLIGHISWNQ